MLHTHLDPLIIANISEMNYDSTYPHLADTLDMVDLYVLNSVAHNLINNFKNSHILIKASSGEELLEFLCNIRKSNFGKNNTIINSLTQLVEMGMKHDFGKKDSFEVMRINSESPDKGMLTLILEFNSDCIVRNPIQLYYRIYRQLSNSLLISPLNTSYPILSEASKDLVHTPSFNMGNSKHVTYLTNDNPINGLRLTKSSGLVLIPKCGLCEDELYIHPPKEGVMFNRESFNPLTQLNKVSYHSSVLANSSSSFYAECMYAQQRMETNDGWDVETYELSTQDSEDF